MIIQYQPAERIDPAKLTPHPLANLFPMMDEASFEDLATDILLNGLQEPIVLMDHQILDGRNRLKACVEVGVTPRFEQFHGKDPAAYVISLNLRRRHLTESQRAMVASKLATVPRGANQHAQICAPSQERAAEMLNVSRRAVQTAKLVQERGTPDLVSAVEQGKVSVAAASVIAKAPIEIQAQVLSEKDEKRLASAAKELRRAQDFHTAVTTRPKSEPLSRDEQQSLAEALGTSEQRGLVMSLLGIGEQVAEFPTPDMFADLVPSAYERTIDDEFKSIRAAATWLNAFIDIWQAKEKANVAAE
jgi:hypothetical protein